ncbi:hypothetical protein FH972_025563 [Carpinus fangiana]|uniref:Major facilitator superfamily transporter n=1 Tax=Carpinus fangiana TaxID=176857 RepID=A0A5N6L1H5_9ROSI|nr:hypothetical protein FH972_025563 [Carpinus fangiana]
MPAFRILKTARPKWRLPDHRHNYSVRDPEKNYDYDENGFDDDWQSEHSSRASSGSYGSEEAMLRPARSFARQPSRAYEDDKAPRRRFNLYFTFVLGSALIVTVLVLTAMGRSSTSAVAAGAIHSRPPVWEEFPMLERYFGGMQTLIARGENNPEYPGDPEQVLEAIRNATSSSEGANPIISTRDSEKAMPMHSHPVSIKDKDLTGIEECFLDEASTIRIPKLHAYSGVPLGFPDHVIGSYQELGLRNDVCFDRFGRLGPYGFGYSRKYGGTSAGMEGDTLEADRIWEHDGQVDFRKVRWSKLQQKCLEKNRHRFDNPPVVASRAEPVDTSLETNIVGEEGAPLLQRAAFLIRTWSDYSYDAEDIMFLRSLISELSLESGGQFEVHFMIHVREDNVQIWSDEETRDRILAESLPEEFHGMATLWSEQQMSLLYDEIEETSHQSLPVHGNFRSAFMPVQLFSHEHPEYDFVWNWEMDVRYTGHLHELLTEAGSWAKSQPRKGLWERNARFYVPAEHGSWEDFKQMVRVQTEHSPTSKPDLWAKFGIKGKNPALHDRPAQKPVWGPVGPDSIAHEYGDVMPPTSYHADHYTWGVNEDADFLTFSPIFNPESTGWDQGHDVTGYDKSSMPPRRASLGTTTRLSRRLLATMHRETALARHTMASEMWPASVALHHGLKAVQVPAPIYIDRQWPVDYLAAVFNGGRNGAAGGSRLSVFSDDREHNLRGTTWNHDESGFAGKMWKRWLGYRVDGQGGEEWELAHEGRMCLPPMLLHPVKQVDLVYDVDVGAK